MYEGEQGGFAVVVVVVLEVVLGLAVVHLSLLQYFSASAQHLKCGLGPERSVHPPPDQQLLSSGLQYPPPAQGTLEGAQLALHTPGFLQHLLSGVRDSQLLFSPSSM